MYAYGILSTSFIVLVHYPLQRIRWYSCVPFLGELFAYDEIQQRIQSKNIMYYVNCVNRAPITFTDTTVINHKRTTSELHVTYYTFLVQYIIHTHIIRT